jgi:hypothetical protein
MRNSSFSPDTCFTFYLCLPLWWDGKFPGHGKHGRNMKSSSSILNTKHAFAEACSARRIPIKPGLSPYLCTAVNTWSLRHFVASSVNGGRSRAVDMSSQICIDTRRALSLHWHVATRRLTEAASRPSETSELRTADIWHSPQDSEEELRIKGQKRRRLVRKKVRNKRKQQQKLHGPRQRTNHTDRATTACPRS